VLTTPSPRPCEHRDGDLFSLPIKEYQIIDILLPKLKGALYMNGDRTNERGVLTRFPRT
jgi:hypothetical protein